MLPKYNNLYGEIKMKLYSIKDNKMGFVDVTFGQNNAIAIRMFGDLIKKHPIYSAHPEDYEIFCLGEVDEDTGEVNSSVSFLERGTSFIPEK